MKKVVKKAIKKPAKRATKPRRRPKLNSHHGYGIVSPYGDMWTSRVFPSAHEAREYLRDFWSCVKGHDLTAYRIVWARQTASFIRDSALSIAA